MAVAKKLSAEPVAVAAPQDSSRGAARGLVRSRILNAPPGCVSSVFLGVCELFSICNQCFFVFKLAKYISFAWDKNPDL